MDRRPFFAFPQIAEPFAAAISQCQDHGLGGHELPRHIPSKQEPNQIQHNKNGGQGTYPLPFDSSGHQEFEIGVPKIRTITLMAGAFDP